MEQDPSELLHQILIEDIECVDKLTDCFRSLRYICAGNPEKQNQLGSRNTFLEDVNTAIERGLNVESDQWTLCLRVCSQFLGNFVVMNVENQQRVWEQCRSQLKRMAQRGDSKLSNVCLMILYNIVLGCPAIIHDLAGDEELIKVIVAAGVEEVEYAQFIIEHMCSQYVDWSKIDYTSLSLNERLFLLGVLEGAEIIIPTSLICQLATHFRKQSDCILRTVADRVNSLEPEEVSQLLKILASKSPNPPHLQALQQDRNLFINCAFLLKSIHMAGKEQNNCFSPVGKVSQADDQLNQHPAFEFKANLVRLLGNMCYEHKENQDMIRELDIIPVLLDCCNIDARNPFIIQWVVLAVRNLCQANPANQSVIAGLTREGVVQSALLTEFGLTLHDDGDKKLHITPLRSSTER